MMNYYNKKCKGCGKYISSDPNSPSFSPKDISSIKYCRRCFRLLNYNELDNSKLISGEITNILDSLTIKDNYIFMILDLFDLENSIIEKYKDFENNIILINKIACLPKGFNSNITLLKIKNILKEQNIKYKKIILYDAIKKINISVIFNELINISELKKKIYFIGKTNVGKSTLINSMLAYDDQDGFLSTSPFPNTTLDFIKVKFKKVTIIDTPGEENKYSFYNLLTKQEIKEINTSNKFISKNFFKFITNKSFNIMKLFLIEVQEIYEQENICFYLNAKTNLFSYKQKNDIENNKLKLDKNDQENLFVDLDQNKKYNIFVPGIALISLFNIKKIKIIKSKKIKIMITENAII